VEDFPTSEWETIQVEGKKRKYQKVRVHDSFCQLRNYKGEVRQLVITDHGREKPTFLITNDFESSIRVLIRKYAKRWLVEQAIAEQIAFFQLNSPSSSIVVKVDFDLTLSLLVHNLYRMLTNQLIGFEQCTVSTINRNFLDNGARVIIKDSTINVYLKKKNHLPILFELPWMKKETYLSWLGLSIKFFADSTS